LGRATANGPTSHPPPNKDKPGSLAYNNIQQQYSVYCPSLFEKGTLLPFKNKKRDGILSTQTHTTTQANSTVVQ
jgi:hypothetical protein